MIATLSVRTPFPVRSILHASPILSVAHTAGTGRSQRVFANGITIIEACIQWYTNQHNPTWGGPQRRLRHDILNLLCLHSAVESAKHALSLSTKMTSVHKWPSTVKQVKALHDTCIHASTYTHVYVRPVSFVHWKRPPILHAFFAFISVILRAQNCAIFINIPPQYLHAVAANVPVQRGCAIFYTPETPNLQVHVYYIRLEHVLLRSFEWEYCSGGEYIHVRQTLNYISYRQWIYNLNWIQTKT